VKWTDEAIEEASRRFEEWADNVDPATIQFRRTDDLRAITRAVDAGTTDGLPLPELVTAARSNGHGWGLIAVMLNMAPQAAREKYGTGGV
jgi:hypothetical protein